MLLRFCRKLPDVDAVVKGPGELAMEALIKTPKGNVHRPGMSAPWVDMERRHKQRDPTITQ